MYDGEEIDSFVNGIPSDKYDYIYSQYGYDYGIQKSK